MLNLGGITGKSYISISTYRKHAKAPTTMTVRATLNHYFN
jgi:hypothetical protein